jgi:hypothetical protein
MINIKYRTWYKAEQYPPRKIKLEIPGWGGETGWKDAAPWHCLPWLQGSAYGCELLYPFKSECRVRAVDGECEFIGDFSEEKEECPVAFNSWDKPFSSFAPNHFGFTSSVDIQTEEGMGTMILPHPRYYTDRTGTVPCPVMGFLESDWWPKIFFIVFKSPLNGQEYVFRQGEPYATLLFLPKDPKYNIKPMTALESQERITLDQHIQSNSQYIATKKFYDSKKQPFDNKYKVLSRVARKDGIAELKNFIVHAKDRRKKGPQLKRKIIWK